jgi:hypothetical protein
MNNRFTGIVSKNQSEFGKSAFSTTNSRSDIQDETIFSSVTSDLIK